MRKFGKNLLFLFAAMTIFPAFGYTVTEKGEVFHVEHAWQCGKKQWTCNLEVEKRIYRYYKQEREHTSDDYMRYILSDAGRPYIADIVAKMRNGGRRAGYSDSDNVRNVVAFVQSMRYVSDLVSTGKKEYVRFPLEMLVDGKGDCEDRVVLMAAILHEMNYELLLVSLPDHLALAIRGDENMDGRYYEYQGKRFYYLETTDKGWDIGVMPDRFVNVKAELIPIEKRPVVYLRSYEVKSIDHNSQTMTFKIVCRVENTGPTASTGMYLYAAARASKQENASVFSEKMFDFDDFAEGQRGDVTLYLTVPRHRRVVFAMTVGGDNFEPKTLYSRVLNVD